MIALTLISERNRAVCGWQMERMLQLALTTVVIYSHVKGACQTSRKPQTSKCCIIENTSVLKLKLKELHNQDNWIPWSRSRHYLWQFFSPFRREARRRHIHCYTQKRISRYHYNEYLLIHANVCDKFNDVCRSEYAPSEDQAHSNFRNKISFHSSMYSSLLSRPSA